MAARREAEGEDCDAAELIGNCRCRPAVERAFAGMLAHGTSESDALDVAFRVYRFHHPEVPARQARDVVQVWVYRGCLH